MSSVEAGGKTSERVMAIYGRIRRRAPAVTAYDDVEDFVSDAITAVLALPEPVWNNNDYYLAQRGMLVARRMRYHERRRAVVFNLSDDDLEWLEHGRFGYTTLCAQGPDVGTVDPAGIETAARNIPEHAQATLALIRKAVQDDETEAFYRSGAIRQTWLCHHMNRTSSAVHRSLTALRTALQPA